MFEIVFALITGYLFGSLSFSNILLRAMYRHSKKNRINGLNPTTGFGGDTVSTMLGTKYGVLVGFLDIAKVIIPMLIFRYLLYPNKLLFLVVSVGGVIGHDWPLFFKFKGGRGISTIYGSFLIVDWMGTLLLTFFSMTFGFFLLQNLIVAYISWIWLIIPWLWLRTHNLIYLVYAVVLNICWILATLPEIRPVLQKMKSKKLDFDKVTQHPSPRWSKMKAIQDTFDKLGKWRLIIAIILIILIILMLDTTLKF
jgi:glycerol-3-phosphate acyltransferase PlsY